MMDVDAVDVLKQPEHSVENMEALDNIKKAMQKFAGS